MSGPGKRLGILVVLLLLSGCAGWPPYHLGTDAQLEQWLSEDRYGPALEVLERRAAQGDAAASGRLEAVRARAAEFDRTQGDRIGDLVEAERWEDAEHALRQAQAKFRDGKQIQNAARRLSEARNARAERLEAELLLARVTWLKHRKPLWEELAEVDPSDLEAPWHVGDTERQLKETGERLGHLGLNALSRRDYGRAEQLLGAAAPLTDNEQFARALDQISEQQSRIREAKQGRAREREALLRRQTVQNLSERIDEAVTTGQLSRAQDLLAELRTLKGGVDASRSLEEKLRAALVQRVEQLNVRAEELYATGKASAAQDTWRRARRALAQLERNAADSADVERLEEGLQETIIRRVQALVREGDRLYAARLGNAARQTWKEARLVLDELQSLYPKQSQVAELQRSLEDTIDGRVQILIKQGDDLYAGGQIAEARMVWQEATQLAPEHPELTSRLERASKVLERLKELKDGEVPIISK